MAAQPASQPVGQGNAIVKHISQHGFPVVEYANLGKLHADAIVLHCCDGAQWQHSQSAQWTKQHNCQKHPRAQSSLFLCMLIWTSCMQMPLSCIAVLGAERQQILSASGVASSQPYTDRKVSFCAWLLVPEQPELLIVEDMLADSR